MTWAVAALGLALGVVGLVTGLWPVGLAGAMLELVVLASAIARSGNA